MADWGAMLFINFGGSCYHFPRHFSAFLSPSTSLSSLSVSAHPDLFLARASLLWNCISAFGVCQLLSARICPSLSVCPCVCIRVCVCERVCISNTVQLATCCEVLHILGACSNASFHFTANVSLILCRTGSALSVFVNVKHAAPRAVFCWAALWNNQPCPGEVKTSFTTCSF